MDTGSLPVAERVSLDVLATVASVTTAAGNAYTLIVERAKSDGSNVPDHLKAILHEDDPVEVADENTACGFKYWRRAYAVQVYIFDATNFLQVKNVVEADVEKALCLDRTRGGWAMLTEIRAPQTFQDATDAVGVLINFECVYRHREEDPYSNG